MLFSNVEACSQPTSLPTNLGKASASPCHMDEKKTKRGGREVAIKAVLDMG